MEIASDAIEPVTGWSIEQLHENVSAAASRTTLVLVNSESMYEELPRALGDPKPTGAPTFRFVLCSTAEQASGIAPPASDPIALSIFCVRTPDPETIQWEDYAYPWARALNLTEAVHESGLQGPRYLLPANDLSWTIHEILASRDAMTCSIEPLDRPFADLR